MSSSSRKILKTIKKNAENEKVGAIKISISFGNGTKKLEKENI